MTYIMRPYLKQPTRQKFQISIFRSPVNLHQLLQNPISAFPYLVLSVATQTVYETYMHMCGDVKRNKIKLLFPLEHLSPLCSSYQAISWEIYY
jgi:hypothetical protein